MNEARINAPSSTSSLLGRCGEPHPFYEGGTGEALGQAGGHRSRTGWGMWGLHAPYLPMALLFSRKTP